jgi:hypothetical protein
MQQESETSTINQDVRNAVGTTSLSDETREMYRQQREMELSNSSKIVSKQHEIQNIVIEVGKHEASKDYSPRGQYLQHSNL